MSTQQKNQIAWQNNGKKWCFVVFHGYFMLFLDWPGDHGSDCRWSYGCSSLAHLLRGTPQTGLTRAAIVQSKLFTPHTLCRWTTYLLPTCWFQTPVSDFQSLVLLRYQAYLQQGPLKLLPSFHAAQLWIKDVRIHLFKKTQTPVKRNMKSLVPVESELRDKH